MLTEGAIWGKISMISDRTGRKRCFTMQEVMTSQQAADFLQTSRDTLIRKARAGQVPAAKFGREWRFRKADLDAWLAAGGDLGEALVNEGMDLELAERKADPANEATRPLEEVLEEQGL